MNSNINFLRGVTVMVTRPEQLASNLAELIEHHGGTAFLYPVIGFEQADDIKQRDQLLANLSAYDIAVFISPTAVQKTFELINRLPADIQVAAIGSSTEAALDRLGVPVSIVSDGHDSEALLKHARLQSAQLAGKSIIIFRGQGGRELLAESLASRGASVSYVEIYKRIRNNNLPSLTKNTLDTIDIIAITSNEGLQNLYDLAEAGALLLNKPLIVPGERCRQLAGQLGFHTIIRASNATDAACIEALQQWARSQQSTGDY